MAGVEAGTERAMALRRLADRARSGEPGPAAGDVSGLHGGTQSHLGLAGELLFGWIFAALIAATIVWFSMAIVPAHGPPPVPIIAPDPRREMGEDLDPRDPLVMCTVFEDHTTCALEES